MDAKELKIYGIALAISVFVIILIVFSYKFYTKPKLNQYCGEFNNYTCSSGKCDYITKYKTGPVGYCRNTIFGF